MTEHRPPLREEGGLQTAAGSDHPLRVMHVVGVLALAGLEYGVIKQVNRLHPGRFAPSICCLYSRAEETRGVLDARIPVYELHHQAGRNRRLVAGLADLLRRERIDVVHSHNWTSYYPSVLAGRMAGVRIVIHGEHGRETAVRLDRRLLAKRVLAWGVTRFVAVAPELAEELVQVWGIRIERVSYIPNGVDLTRFHPDPPSRDAGGAFGFPPDARIATIIGGIRPVKDHATLVRAFARVIARDPRARLLIVGTDSGSGLCDELDRLASSLGIRHAVHFAGVRDDIPGLLALSHVYVNCSVSEGMSNTILEAMAAGKPVVATSVGGNGLLVRDGETGFLAPAGDPDALADRIGRVLADPESAARMGKAARAFVERRHRMDRMMQEYETLYLDPWQRRRLRRETYWREAPRRIVSRGVSALWSIAALDRLRGPRLPILRYRRVLPLAEASSDPFPARVTPKDVFECQMGRLKRNYRVLPLDEALRRLREGTLPRRAAAVVLEDGYRDVYEQAWPVLRRYGIPATLFPVTDVLDRRGRLWWDDVAAAVARLRSAGDRLRGLDALPRWASELLQERGGPAGDVAARLVQGLAPFPRAERERVLQALLRLAGEEGGVEPEPMLSWDEVREMAGEGMAVGTHTRTHVRLDELTAEEAHREVSDSAARISRELGTPVRWLACPGGGLPGGTPDFLARAGIEAALTGESGLNAPGTPLDSLRTLDAGALHLEGGFGAGIFDAGLAQLPGRLHGARPEFELPGA